MAAISHVFTIRRAAQILGRDEDVLWELSDQLEPEDGKLWVYDIDALKPPPSPTMASRRFAKLSRIRSIAPVNLKTSVPRCSAYAYVSAAGLDVVRCTGIAPEIVLAATTHEFVRQLPVAPQFGDELRVQDRMSLRSDRAAAVGCT